MMRVPPAGFEPATSGLGSRCSVPLSYEGSMSGDRGIRTLSAKHLLYRQARLSYVGASPWGDWRGSSPLPPGSRPGALAGELQPPCRAYPRRASNPRPPVCRTGAPPVELHGHVFRGADGPRTRNVSRVKAGRLCPLLPPRLASGWRDSNARPLGSGPSALTKLSHNPLMCVPGRGVEPRKYLVLGQAPFPVWLSGREWRRGDSNPLPPLCKSGALTW
jgi:hypothetical protein